MTVSANTMVVNYTANIVYPSGETFQITGSFPLAAGSDAGVLTAAATTAAATAIATDVAAKITTGAGPALPPLVTRQSIARGRI